MIPRFTRRVRIGRVLLAMLGTAPLWLWALNGTWLARGTHPRQGQVVAASARPAALATNHVTVMAFNIAKCFVHEGRGRLSGRDAVEAR